MKTFTALVLAGWIFVPASAAEPKAFTTGEIRLRVVSGPQENELRYRLKGDQMRIDQPGEIVPAPPVNLLDLKSGNLRILHPHNGTWQEMSADSLRPAPPGIPGMSAPPPGIGPMQEPAITPPGQPGRPPAAEPAGAPGIKPDLPGMPEIPRMPEIPHIPEIPRSPQLPPAASSPGILPSGIGPPALGNAGGVPLQPPIPRAVPSMPRNFPGQADTPELKATDEKRVIHGYECTRHTITLSREGQMSLWLSAPGIFPPFHLLLDDVPRRQFRPDWSGQIPALLRQKDLFPLLAEWISENGQETVRWEVTRLAPGAVEDPDGGLFKVPETYYQLGNP